MIRFVDNGNICGWFYCSEGQYLGDGTRADAERIKANIEGGY